MGNRFRLGDVGSAAERRDHAFFDCVERHRIRTQYARGSDYRDEWERLNRRLVSPDRKIGRERQCSGNERLRLNFGDGDERPALRKAGTSLLVRRDRLPFAEPPALRPYEEHRENLIPALRARRGFGRSENDLQQRKVRPIENRRQPRNLSGLRYRLFHRGGLSLALGERMRKQFTPRRMD